MGNRKRIEYALGRALRDAKARQYKNKCRDTETAMHDSDRIVFRIQLEQTEIQNLFQACLLILPVAPCFGGNFSTFCIEKTLKV